MKYYKITLGKEPGGTLIYPQNYQVEVGNFATDHLYYDDKGETYLVLVIEDKNSADILRDGIEEISEADLQAISDEFEAKVTVIKDEGEVRRLELKSSLGLPITADEEDKLDLNHPDSIFKKSETLADRTKKLDSKLDSSEKPSNKKPL